MCDSSGGATAVATPTVGMKPPEKSAFSHLLRTKLMNKSGKKKRMSCKDLGDGDCQGWLLKRSSGRIRDTWSKYWFVLKERNLYYYKDPNDDSYLGRFHLAGFRVSPADNEKSSKCAFRVFHADHGSYFMASDRQQDMVKWMNFLSIATLDLCNNNDEEKGSVSGDEDEQERADNDNHVHPIDALPEVDENVSLTSSSEAENRCSTPSTTAEPSADDDFDKILVTLRQSNVSVLAGCRKSIQRLVLDNAPSSSSSDDVAVVANGPASPPSDTRRADRCVIADKYSRLQALRRTLKDKECQLMAVDDLLKNTSISRDLLTQFQCCNPAILVSLPGHKINDMDDSISV